MTDEHTTQLRFPDWKAVVEEALKDVVTLSEIAERCGVTRNAMEMQRERDPDFPLPVRHFNNGTGFNVFYWPEVREYRKRKRLPIDPQK